MKITTRERWLRWLWLELGLVMGLAGAAYVALPEEVSAEEPSRGDVSFKLFGGYLIAMEGRIGDHHKLKFVLDTGVTHSVIDRRLADQLSGRRHESGSILRFDKTIHAAWLEVPDIEFGPIHVSNFSMMIGDLKYFQSYATNVDSVIGLDLLRLSSFSIDYSARRITFSPVTSALSVPMDVDNICLTVQLKVGNSHLRLLVDTGAQALVLYEDRVSGRLPQLVTEGEASGRSMSGWVRSKRGFIPDVRLGSAGLDGTVFLVKTPHGTFLADVDGYFGVAALKARQINFNFETNTLSWKR